MHNSPDSKAWAAAHEIAQALTPYKAGRLACSIARYVSIVLPQGYSGRTRIIVPNINRARDRFMHIPNRGPSLYKARPVPSPVHLYSASTSRLRNCCSPKSSGIRPRTCARADRITLRKFRYEKALVSRWNAQWMSSLIGSSVPDIPYSK